MLLLGRPLASVDETTLRELIEVGAEERRVLDFKRELTGKSSGHKAELAADASSFANTVGGHIVFGMEEKEGHMAISYVAGMVGYVSAPYRIYCTSTFAHRPDLPDLRMNPLAACKPMHLLLLLLVWWPVVGVSQGVGDYVWHTDEVYKFAVAYPNDWLQTPLLRPDTRFKATNSDLDHFQSVNVVIQDRPELQGISAEDLVDYLLSEEGLEAMLSIQRQVASNATIIEHGRTYISDTPAFYSVTNSSTRSLDDVNHLTQLQFIVVKGTMVYTITLAADTERFEEDRPYLEVIAASFTLLP